MHSGSMPHVFYNVFVEAGGHCKLIIMKKLFSIVVILLIAFSAHAQQNVTKFLGIPVDGTKAAMIAKLKAKGFKASLIENTDLKGRFNGIDVLLGIQTDKGKVWRICVIDENSCDETNIKIRFNTLFNQFVENQKYITAEYNVLSDEEDISYEMLVHKKRYEATFFQKPEEGAENRVVWFMISKDILGMYRIAMYYENGLNAANGEDL